MAEEGVRKNAVQGVASSNLAVPTIQASNLQNSR
jgi:hypothetical protein